MRNHFRRLKGLVAMHEVLDLPKGLDTPGELFFEHVPATVEHPPSILLIGTFQPDANTDRVRRILESQREFFSRRGIQIRALHHNGRLCFDLRFHGPDRFKDKMTALGTWLGKASQKTGYVPPREELIEEVRDLQERIRQGGRPAVRRRNAGHHRELFEAWAEPLRVPTSYLVRFSPEEFFYRLNAAEEMVQKKGGTFDPSEWINIVRKHGMDVQRLQQEIACSFTPGPKGVRKKRTGAPQAFGAYFLLSAARRLQHRDHLAVLERLRRSPYVQKTLDEFQARQPDLHRALEDEEIQACIERCVHHLARTLPRLRSKPIHRKLYSELYRAALAKSAEPLNE